MDDFIVKNISDLEIKIDRTSCIATANCIKVAPDVFELDDENIRLMLFMHRIMKANGWFPE